ncbi:MAG: hypothetical protein R3A78_02755 [Polyangiales bacterium]|nr:hypothetical protein [Myxococcales bacterium]
MRLNRPCIAIDRAHGCGAWAFTLVLLVAASAFAEPEPAPEWDDDEPDTQLLPGPTREPVTRALARYAHEPSVERVITWARRVARSHPADVEALRSRARLRGLVPVVRLGVRRGQGQDLSAYQTAEDDRTNLSTDDDLTLQAWATFSFDRLVYAPEESALWRVASGAHARDQELVRTVVGLYFERRRLQLARDLEGDRDITHALRIREITALLNAFTGGAFLRIIERR